MHSGIMKIRDLCTVGVYLYGSSNDYKISLCDCFAFQRIVFYCCECLFKEPASDSLAGVIYDY